MTSLILLRESYRYQHQRMTTKQNDVIKTTRRQKQFRPRGDVYTKLLRLEAKW